MEDNSASHWPISLTNGAAAMFNLFLPLALVRILTPAQMGVYKIFFLYVMLSPGLFLTSGLNSGLYYWIGKDDTGRPHVRESWTLLVAISLSIALVGCIFASTVAPLARISVHELRLFLISTPFLLASMFLEDLMIARGSIWTGALYAAIFDLLRGASLVLAAWWFRSIEGVIGVYLATAAVRALMGWWIVKSSGEINLIISWKKSKEVFRYAVPVSVASLSALVLQNMDQMILSVRLNPEKFAYYAMGCLTIPPLLILQNSVNRVLIPKLSHAFAQKKPLKAAELYSEGVSELFKFLFPATIGLVIYSDPIIRILFTEHYLPAVPYLRVYAFYYLCFALPYDAVARAVGDGKWILRIALIFSLPALGATWIVTGHWGAMGALISFLSVQILIRLYSFGHQSRFFGVPYTKFIPFKEIGLQTCLTVLAAVFSILIHPLFSNSITWFLVTGPIFTAIYFGSTYLLYLRQRSTHKTMHVLELSQTLGLGGLERTVYLLSRELHQRKDFEVMVAIYDQKKGDPSLTAQFQESGIPLEQWEKRKGFSFRSVFRLLKIIYSKNTRVIHGHDLGPLIYGCIAKLLSLGRVHLFVTLHTLLDIRHNRRYRIYYKIFLRFADRIIAVSEGVKIGLLSIGIDPRRIEVIPNGVVFSLSTFNSHASEKMVERKHIMPGLPSHLYGSRWMLCLARLHAGKGQDLVLDIWRALPEYARAELTLFFVGQETQPGYRELLKQKILDLPDHDRVIIAGPSEFPHRWVRASDFFISGSRYEGMPLAPLEAAGAGLPTILSDIEGHRFLSSWAHYFDVKKPAEGAQRILEIMASMRTSGENRFFEERWNETASLRNQWSAPAMANSYAEMFQTN